MEWEHHPMWSSQLTFLNRVSLPKKLIAPQLKVCVGWGGESLPLHVGMVTVIVLCSSCVGSHSHYDLMSATTLSYSIKHCFTVSFPNCGSYMLSLLSSMILLSLGEGVWCRHPGYDWACHRHFASFWSVVNFCVTCCQLTKELSSYSKSCIHLCVQRYKFGRHSDTMFI